MSNDIFSSSSSSKGDIKITWNNNDMEGDFSFINNDLLADEGLETAVLMSIFTDRRARDEDTLPDPVNGTKRGWFGDALSDIEGDEIGSRLWLLERSKATIENVELAKEAIEESLQWLIDDLVAARVDVTVEVQGDVYNRVLAFMIKIFKTDGTIVSFKYDSQWEGTV